jgi:hypothetical protein
MMGRMVLLEGADLLEREPRDGRKVRPWLVFTVLGALVLAALAYVIVRAIPQDPQPVRDPMRPSVPQGFGPSSTELIPRISAARAAGLTSESWQLTGIDAGGRALELFYIGGDGYCHRPVGVYVQESADRVTIEAASTSVPDNTACPTPLVTGSGRVLLREPLGSRPLYHGAVDPNDVYAFDEP